MTRSSDDERGGQRSGLLGLFILIPSLMMAASALLGQERTELGATLLTLSVIPIVLGANLIWEELSNPPSD